MARHRRDRTFAILAGTLLRREDGQASADQREAPRHAAGASASGRGGLTPSPAGPPSGEPVPLSGTCSCGRERNNVTLPGIVGDRWFRNVFTQCECGEVMMLTIGQRPTR
jgi:hypothetical protein